MGLRGGLSQQLTLLSNWNSLHNGPLPILQGTLDWDSHTQAWLFAATFWGAMMILLPAGWLADRYGSKVLWLLSSFVHLFGTLLTPLAADFGVSAAFAARFVVGLGQVSENEMTATIVVNDRDFHVQGMQTPAVLSWCSRWYPKYERATVLALYTSGNQVASIVGNPLTAYLCRAGILGGWPAIFYITGLLYHARYCEQ